MEENIKRTIHFEFYGLPGSGKSTISHVVANKLREKGFKVYEPTYSLDHEIPKYKRQILKLYYAVIYFGKCPGNARKIVCKLRKMNISFLFLFKSIVNIFSKLFFYRNNSSGLYLWDEGLAQSSIACSLDNVGELKTLIDELSAGYNIQYIYIQMDEEKALQYMASRKDNDSRIEKEKDSDTRRNMLKKFTICCNALSSDLQIKNCVLDNSINKILEYITVDLQNEKNDYSIR